jgi:hypothetical protein
MSRRITNAMIRELCRITTRTESGEHFTTAFSHWADLELAGLVEVDRPIHGESGIAYSAEHWTIMVTPAGQSLVESHTELHPA